MSLTNIPCEFDQAAPTGDRTSAPASFKNARRLKDDWFTNNILLVNCQNLQLTDDSFTAHSDDSSAQGTRLQTIHTFESVWATFSDETIHLPPRFRSQPKNVFDVERSLRSRTFFANECSPRDRILSLGIFRRGSSST
jgi:hypothetical protein